MTSPRIPHLLGGLLALALAVPGSTSSSQQKPVDSLLTVGKYLDLEQVTNPQLSPDGSQIVYTRRWVNKLEDRWESGLWIIGADGSKNRFLTKGANAVWSSDGSRIAYLADGEPKGTQIFVRFMDASGASTQITRESETPADIRWSPDGKWIGFSMMVPKTTSWKIDMPDAPKGSNWTAAPRIVQSRHFRQDQRGFIDPGFRHLFIVPADGGTPRQITHGDWSIGQRFDALDGAVGWDWSRDGRTIYADGLADSTWDANYVKSNIYSIDVATGAMHSLTAKDGSWASPVLSPDGRKIAYRGYTEITDSYHASEPYVMNIDGTAPRKIASLDRDIGNIFWSDDGGGLYFTVEDHGTSNVDLAPLAGPPRAITSGIHMLTALRMVRGGRAVGLRATSKSPNDVVAIRMPRRGRSADVVQLTHVNDDLLAGVRLGDVEHMSFASTGGTQVDGWIVKPPGFDATKKYPLIMEIHGGPHGAYTVAFSYSYQNFASNGFVVLYTNPRGSTGYGSAFGNAIMHRYPGVDYEDLMAGVDALVGRGYIDTTRMYVGGCSGGGVLSSWVIGHTNRFAAAAVRCPVINWMSFIGQTDVPLFTQNFFDAPFWEKPEQWLKQSPLMYVGNVTTPTIVMTGELDLRTPIPQSEEYYGALKTRGVPSALFRFAGEYHGTTSKPSNFMRTQLYMMSWYNRWRRTGPAATQVTSNQ